MGYGKDGYNDAHFLLFRMDLISELNIKDNKTYEKAQSY